MAEVAPRLGAIEQRNARRTVEHVEASTILPITSVKAVTIAQLTDSPAIDEQ